MNPTVQTTTTRVVRGQRERCQDVLAVEDPLEIRVNDHSVAVTMRTPGHDFELAAGFLLTEGVIDRPTDLRQIRHCARSPSNVVRVDLDAAVTFDTSALTRHVFTSSSCGICSKASLDQVRTALPQAIREPARFPSASVFQSLPGKLTKQQTIFSRTGGLHATAMFDLDGNLLAVREDVGRHNAMDKLVGAMVLADQLPAHDRIVLVSGRASFELVQKAAMAGFPVLAAVGAPSSLAAELATEIGMMLVGFLRDGRFNVYSGTLEP